MKKLLLIVAILVIAALVGMGSATDYDRIFTEWNGASIKELKQKANQYLVAEKMDSALMFYTMTANKYHDNLPDSDKWACASAYNDAGYVYFYDRHDYSSSYTCLLKSQEIAEETGHNAILPYVYLNMGNIYISYQDYDAAIDFYRKSFYASIKTKAWTILLTTLDNLISTTMSYKDVAGVMPEVRTFHKLRIPQMEMLDYTRSMCHAAEAAYRKDNNAAIQWLDKAVTQVDTRLTPERYIWGAKTLKANIYAKQKNYQAAIAVMAEVERQTQGTALDLQGEACKLLSQYYSQLGQADEAMRWNNLGLQLSDSLFRSQQYGLIRDMKSTFEIKKVDAKMREAENHRRVMAVVLSIVGVGAIVFLVMALLIYRKNQRLKTRNRDLFRRNEEMMRLGENERRLREVYEGRIKLYEEELTALRTPPVQETPSDDAPTEAKYQSSSLDDYAKQQLLNRINQVMDNVEEISVTDFSVSRLAKLVDSNSKYVSQVINEAYGKSFTTLLGEVRVRQACLRLCDTEAYGNLTIEAIAMSLGFKSRSNFVTVFKRVTGLTPSDYKKMGVAEKGGK